MRIIKIMFVGAALTALGLAARAQPGLVAHYPLNGNANDAAGSLHGTVIGATPTTNRFGQPNSAYSFNGSNSRIEFNAPPLAQTNNWTISAWVKPGNFTQEGMAVHVGFDNFSTGDGFGYGFNGNSTWQGLFPPTSGYRSSGQALPNTNQWYHVVMQRGTGPLFFYINGVQTMNNTPTIFTVPTDFTIGSQNGARFFNGLIDDVRIFNRAISSNEVVQLYNDVEFCTPHAATAQAAIFNGFVVGATVTDEGCGYTNTPLVTIVGGGGSNATATATVTNGRVTAINITGAGCCYSNPPQIIISSPPFVPTVSIAFSRVNVTQRVGIGRNYVLEYTTNLVDWLPTGPPFTAQSETVVSEFELNTTGRHFRLREVP